MNAMQYTTRVDAVLRCGSMRFEPVQYRYWYGIEILCKNFWTWPKKFFRRIVVTESPGIDTGYDAGQCGSIRFWYRLDPVRNPAVCDCSITNSPRALYAIWLVILSGDFYEYVVLHMTDSGRSMSYNRRVAVANLTRSGQMLGTWGEICWFFGDGLKHGCPMSRQAEKAGCTKQRSKFVGLHPQLVTSKYD
jgi:hypothetical protein